MGDSSQPKFLKASLAEVGFLGSTNSRLALNTGSISKNLGADYGFLRDYGVVLEGCDIEAGENVNHIFDLTHEPPEHLIEKYDLIISSTTLEHVVAPWRAASCLEKLLRPKGFIYVSVPWVWEYHAYPNDYWRFNQHSLNFLFGNSEVKCQSWSTSPDCVLYPYDDSFDHENSVDLPSNWLQFDLFIRKVMHRLMKGHSLAYHRKYLPYLMIHQLRQKN